ncbi:MAG: EAL domain-containing protein [Acidobacteria bacterium]|nr:EAL domain-containing protein [Acidobacteriota bacterium]
MARDGGQDTVADLGIFDGHEASYRQIVEHAQQGIWAFGTDQQITMANLAMAEVLGVEGPESLIGRPLADFIANDLQPAIATMREQTDNGHVVRRVGHLVRHDGSEVYVIFRISRLPRDDGYFATVADLTDWHAAQNERDEAIRQVRLSEERYRQIVETAEEGIVTIDLDRTITFANRRLADMLGSTVEALVGAPAFPFQSDPNRRFAPTSIKRFQRELVTIRADGTELHVLVKMNPLMDSAGTLIGHLAMLTDLTDRKAYEEQLAFQAEHDPLTRLPNRTLFMERLQEALVTADRSKATVAVVFLDLDGFKAINSRYGHDGGDELLVCIAERLAGSVRPTDTVGRFGGDEFVVLAVGGGDFVGDLGDRLRSAIDLPCSVGGVELRVGASMGIAVATRDSSAASLLRDADLALLHAKDSGRMRTELFTEHLRHIAEERAAITVDLRRATDHNEFSLRYQPVVNLEDRQIIGVEALLRWDHPLRGTLAPEDFMKIAEETELIVPIGAWVLHESFHQLAQWHSVVPELALSVNVSTRQLASPRFPGTVTDALRASGVDPRRVALEITETAFTADIDACIVGLTKLRDAGLAIVLDDFGTGYSSLSALKRLPVDGLKIDQSFVAGLPFDTNDVALLRAMFTMAEALGLDVVAEGVENAAQAAALRALGGRRAQGFHFHHPLTAAALLDVVKAGLQPQPSR